MVFLLFAFILTLPGRLIAQTNCITPANLTATNISPTGAVLYAGTTGTTGVYNIRYHGPNSTTWVTLNNVTMPFQLGNLTCHTAYEWQAQQVCGTNPNNVTVLSAWSAGSAFTTANCPEPTCPVPTYLSTTNISQTGAVLNLGTIANTGIHNIRYRVPNSTTWITVNNVTMPFQLGNLTCHTGYEWQAQKVCTTPAGTAPVLSAWSASVTFMTTACPEPTCPVPTNLAATGISANGAVLYIGTATNSGRYNIRYHGPNSSDWITLNNVTMPFQLGNLTCNTTYEWQAQQVCATSSTPNAVLSAWSAGVAFTTATCPAPTCPVPTYLTTTSITANGAVLYISPASNTVVYNVRYHGPNSTDWITLNNVTMPFQLGNLTCHTTYEWQAQQVCAGAAGTTAYLSPWSAGVAFTTATCPEPTCPVPANLATTNISASGAVLTLGTTANAGRYNIRYHGPNATWITVNNVTLPFQLGNLVCNTIYEWQAQQICGSTPNNAAVLSPWSTATAFTTANCPAPTCPTPTYLTTTNISTNGAVLYISPASNTVVYNIRYHGPNASWITLNNVTMPFQLGNLTCHTTYEWQAQQVCSGASGTTGNLSAWSAGVSFTTANCPAPDCPAPVNLTATNISANGAVLYLGITTNTGIYNIRYHGPNSTTWITLNNVTIPFQLGNLTCNTAYEWQAQKMCGTAADGTHILSPWSVGAAFTTANCPVDTCPVPTYLSTTNISQTGAVLNLGSIANTGIHNIRYRIPNSTTWVNVNNVTMPFQLGNLTCHTAYEWQAQKVCTTTAGTAPVLSTWSASVTFITTNCPTPTCPVPTNLAATGISANGAVLYIGTTTNAGRYNIRYHGPNATWITVNNVTMPFQLGNLTCSTAYEWQAQQICPTSSNTNAVLSAWSTAMAFTTANCPVPTCPVPTYLSTTNISANGAVLTIGTTTNAGRYNIRYHGPNATWITLNNVTMPFQLRNLVCNTVYEWQAQKVCGTAADGMVTLSPWSAGIRFTTASCHVNACPVPSNLSATNISANGAVLRWNGIPGAVAYTVRYKPVNSTLPYRMLTSTTNMMQIGGLTAGTAYVWQVATVCPNGTTIATWSPQSVFTTSSSLHVYPNPANQNTSVSFWSDRVATVDVKLLDLYGKEIVTQKREAVEGVNVFGVDTSGVADGLYMIGIYSDAGLTTTKVIIKH
ncbi:hypothetical protein FLJC2902T_16270 [Flavobacterium limnosediminis JC2902]|uniref:Fibronectin type-III domain-containing protein n=2 Tax=Flavobacterium TaxID=237 RepID=V6SPB7_9FLAO|nr:hypothetical protein FLJC2902T_16270 [Flavobacterium limnosediminis JC2902]